MAQQIVMQDHTVNNELISCPSTPRNQNLKQVELKINLDEKIADSYYSKQKVQIGVFQPIFYPYSDNGVVSHYQALKRTYQVLVNKMPKVGSKSAWQSDSAKDKIDKQLRQAHQKLSPMKVIRIFVLIMIALTVLFIVLFLIFVFMGLYTAFIWATVGFLIVIFAFVIQSIIYKCWINSKIIKELQLITLMNPGYQLELAQQCCCFNNYSKVIIYKLY